jgi:hypothetical protein
MARRNEWGLSEKEQDTTVSKTRTRPSATCSADSWRTESTDIKSEKVSPTYTPTTVYWVAPQGTATSKIVVYDVSKDIHMPYIGMTNDYAAEVKRALNDHIYTPAITIEATHWLGLKYQIKDEQGNHVAHWSHPLVQLNDALLVFPEKSPHATHPISVRNKTWSLGTETFTCNTHSYVWEMDSLWHTASMTLYKVVGSGDRQAKVKVAQFAKKWWGGAGTGGAFVVDEKELDGVVACLTLLVKLKKNKQLC